MTLSSKVKFHERFEIRNNGNSSPGIIREIKRLTLLDWTNSRSPLITGLTLMVKPWKPGSGSLTDNSCPDNTKKEEDETETSQLGEVP